MANCTRKDFWHDRHPGDDVLDDVFYSTNFYTSTAVSLIEGHNRSRPLWIHLAYQAVHSPYTNPPQWENATVAAGFDHAKYCGGVCAGCHPQEGGCPPEKQGCDKTQCSVFSDMVFVVDDGIGNVTSALKTTGWVRPSRGLASSSDLLGGRPWRPRIGCRSR